MIRLERIDPVPGPSTEEDKAVGFDLVGFPLSRAGEQAWTSVCRHQFGPPGRDDPRLQRRPRGLSRIRHHPADLAPVQPDGAEDRHHRPPRHLRKRPLWPRAERGRQHAGATTTNSCRSSYRHADPRGRRRPRPGHPYHLSTMLHAIDQYVMRGRAGRRLPRPRPPNIRRRRPAIPPFRISCRRASTGSIIRRRASAWRRTRWSATRTWRSPSAPRPATRFQTVDYLPWLIVDQSINPDDIATAQLTLMRIQSAWSIVPIEGAETTLTPLIRRRRAC